MRNKASGMVSGDERGKEKDRSSEQSESTNRKDTQYWEHKRGKEKNSWEFTKQAIVLEK